MPINERDQAILKGLDKAALEDPVLSAYYELHRTLLHTLAEARTGMSATLEMVDGEALQARLLQGLPLLSFGQVPLEAERFAELVSTVAGVLRESNPDLGGETVPDSPAECLTLARQRFAAGQAGAEQAGEGQARPGRGEEQSGASLAEVVVDLALKPYLQWAAEQVLPHIDQERWKRGYCPVCGGAPDFACLEENAGARHLVCSRCSSQWLYHRLECPFCGTDDHTKLFYYTSEDEAYRLYVCQACRRYLKVVDLRRVGRQVLLPVERITTVAMDVAARQEGYR